MHINRYTLINTYIRSRNHIHINIHTLAQKNILSHIDTGCPNTDPHILSFSDTMSQI